MTDAKADEKQEVEQMDTKNTEEKKEKKAKAKSSVKKRRYDNGQQIDPTFKIEAPDHVWQNNSVLIQKVLTTYTTINIEELEKSMDYIKNLCQKGLSAKNFTGVLKEHINSIQREDIEGKMVGIVRKRSLKDPNTNLHMDRDVMASIVDSIAKAALGIDPFTEKEMYICSVL